MNDAEELAEKAEEMAPTANGMALLALRAETISVPSKKL